MSGWCPSDSATSAARATKPEGVAEVGEGELAVQLLVALALPLGHLLRQLGGLLFGQRRSALLAGLAVL